MASVNKDYLKHLQAQPKARFRAIIRTTGVATDYTTILEDAGLVVHQVFSLVAGAAVEGEAEKIISLLHEPWVTKIEPDTSIHSLDDEGKVDNEY